MLGGGPVVAQTAREVETARELFAEAEQDQAAERWADALDKLERVATIKETAGVRFHLADCQERLGMLVKALRSFERSQQLASAEGSTDVLELVGPRVASLRVQVATLRMRVPKGEGAVTVRLDHAVFSDMNDGEELTVDPGTHQVVIEVGGKVRLDRLVTVTKGQTETLRVRPAKPVAPRPAAGAAQGASAALGASRSSCPLEAAIALGAGSLLGVGGYLAYHKADTLARRSAKVCATNRACDPERADRVRQWDAVALGVWVGAAVAMGAGVAIALTRDSKAPQMALVVRPDQLQLRTTY
jgi:hypothetical protein